MPKEHCSHDLLVFSKKTRIHSLRHKETILHTLYEFPTGIWHLTVLEVALKHFIAGSDVSTGFLNV